MTTRRIIVKNKELARTKSALEKIISIQTDMVLAIRWAFRLERIKEAIVLYQMDLQGLRKSGYFADEDDLETLKEKEVFFEFMPIDVNEDILERIGRERADTLSDFIREKKL